MLFNLKQYYKETSTTNNGGISIWLILSLFLVIFLSTTDSSIANTFTIKKNETFALSIYRGLVCLVFLGIFITAFLENSLDTPICYLVYVIMAISFTYIVGHYETNWMTLIRGLLCISIIGSGYACFKYEISSYLPLAIIVIGIIFIIFEGSLKFVSIFSS